MNNILYICAFLISAFITYLLRNDFKMVKRNLYNKIYYKIWIKVYALITIFLIHAFWLFRELFLNNNNSEEIAYIYGVPIYLLIAYAIYLYAYIKPDHLDAISIESQKIDKWLNILMILYLFFIILIITIPNNIKKYIIQYVKKEIYNFLELKC
jgi:membrane protease YdiL (CAAX protease family)